MMKKLGLPLAIVLAGALLATVFPACGRKAAPVAVGAAVTVTEPVDIARLTANPAGFAGQTVLLKGVVKEVCQGMGCWVEVAGPDGASFLARSLDESVLLPMDCRGRQIMVQGVVTMLPAKAPAESKPEGHTCPRPDYVVATQGAVLPASK